MAKANLKATASMNALEVASDNNPTMGDVVQAIETELEKGNLPEPGIGHNKPPAITEYAPAVTDKAHAIQGIQIALTGMRRSLNDADSKLNRLSLFAADYLYYLWVESSMMDQGNRKVPSLDEFKSKLNLIVNGRVHVTETVIDDVKTLKIVQTPAPKALTKEQKNKLIAEVGDIVDRAKFSPTQDATMSQYIQGASYTAFLVLYGQEKTKSGEGTTYRKGYRWISKGPGHAAGDVYLIEIGEKNDRKVIPFPVDQDAPDGTYLGVIYNDHALHPKIQTSMNAVTKEPIYQLRSENGVYMRKPWVGATLASAKAHFERFFGKKDAESKLLVPVTVNPETGVPDVAERETGGTASETGTSSKETEEKTIANVDLSNLTREQRWSAVLSMARNLPTKAETLSEAERDMISDLHMILDTWLEEHGMADDEENDTDETIERVAAA